jgi:hypothetical protein
MKSRDAFEVVVRTVGLLLMVAWVFALANALLHRDGALTFLAFLMFATGGYLLKGAPTLLDWAYAKPRVGEEELVDAKA